MAAGGALPEALRQWYEWHDGLRDEHTPVEGNFGWCSTTAAVAHKKRLDEMEAQGLFADWPSGEWWNPGWLPFLQFNLEDFVCVDLPGKLGHGKGAVFVRRNADPTRVVLAPSFHAWLHAHVTITAAREKPASEEEWIAHFQSEEAQKIRSDLDPGFPTPVTARQE